MNRLLFRIIAIAILTLSFSAEMRAQFVNQVGVRSDYVNKGKIYIGGAPLAREDAVKVLGEDLGQQYNKELNKKGAAKVLLIIGGAAVGMGALWAASFQIVYPNVSFDENPDMDKLGAQRKLKGLAISTLLVGGGCMIAGGVISQSATKNLNAIRNAYNKSLSEREVSYSVGFTGNGVGFALKF